MSKYIFLCFVFFPTLRAHAQDQSAVLSSDVSTIVSKMDERNSVRGSAVGGAAMKPIEYEYFEQLLAIASDAELQVLVDHENPCVRSYAFWGLAKRQSDLLESLLSLHLFDNEPFVFQSGCSVSTRQVSHFMLEVVTPGYIDNCGKLKRSTINRLKREKGM